MAARRVARRRTVTRYVGRARRRRAAKTTIPLAVIAGLLPGISRSYDGFKVDGIRGASYRLCNDFTGYDPYQGRFSASELRRGLLPLVFGYGIHWLFGSKLGINRALGRAKIPLIRL